MKIFTKTCYILQFYYDKGTSAAKTHRKYVLFTAKLRYRKDGPVVFGQEIFDVKDAPHSCRLIKKKVGKYIAQAEENQDVSSHDTYP